MSYTWSEHIHSPECLFACRNLRFRHEMKCRFLDVFSLPCCAKIRVLEIGCGSGAFAKRLAEWYPNAEVVGIDSDERYISFARIHVKHVAFYSQDLAAMDEFVASQGKFDVVFTHSMFGFVNSVLLMNAIVCALSDGGKAVTISNRLSMGVHSRLWDPVCPEYFTLKSMDREIDLLKDKKEYSTDDLLLILRRSGMQIEKVDYVSVPMLPMGECHDEVLDMYRLFQWNRLLMLGRRCDIALDVLDGLCKRNDDMFAERYLRDEEMPADAANVDVLEIVVSRLPCAGHG